jgi:hypothetical protein
MYNMPNKIEICINMPNIQKHTKYAKTCKIRFHIFNCGILKWISMSSSIKYNFARLICKCMNLRAMMITVAQLTFQKVLAMNLISRLGDSYLLNYGFRT